jgi:hypothetical protein
MNQSRFRCATFKQRCGMEQAKRVLRPRGANFQLCSFGSPRTLDFEMGQTTGASNPKASPSFLVGAPVSAHDV